MLLISDEITPDSTESIYANWAQDTIIAIYELLLYYLDRDDKHILKIALTSIETIEKFIHHTYGYIDRNVNNFGEIILEYKEILSEIQSQNDELNQLKNLTVLNNDSILMLKKKISEVSNIGLQS